MSIYEIRKAGREYCQTEGSEHYKAVSALEPMDLIIAKGLAEDFCLANIIKYAARFKQTQNLNDLKKAADYSQILVGIKLDESNVLIRTKCDGGRCVNSSIRTAKDVIACQELLSKNDIKWADYCRWRNNN